MNDKTLTYVGQSSDYNLPTIRPGLDLETGIFTAPTTKLYMVTLTAKLARNDDTEFSSYAQLFLLKNGNLESLKDYLLVDQGKLGDLRVEVNMVKEETLQVFVGHHISQKSGISPSGSPVTFGGFNLEDVRFCIFWKYW